jgi:hypothetical protein
VTGEARGEPTGVRIGELTGDWMMGDRIVDPTGEGTNTPRLSAMRTSTEAGNAASGGRERLLIDWRVVGRGSEGVGGDGVCDVCDGSTGGLGADVLSQSTQSRSCSPSSPDTRVRRDGASTGSARARHSSTAIQENQSRGHAGQ